MWDTTVFSDKSLWPTDGSQPFVYSMGDGTGYGQHGDCEQVYFFTRVLYSLIVRRLWLERRRAPESIGRSVQRQCMQDAQDADERSKHQVRKGAICSRGCRGLAD